ncbi:MAG: YdhR family protein [Dehalococcoidia bacterium]
MHALLVLWDLTDSNATFEELREYLADRSIPRFEQMAGLRQKTWISSPETRRWGALYLFETREQAQAVIDHLPESPVVEITGTLPSYERFDVEAVVEGQHSGIDLLASGLARSLRAG